MTGVAVDVSGKTAEAARLGGWRIAQRKAWAMLAQRLGRSGTGASDGLLDSLVSGIVIENEQIGPTRYVAKLGVLFDRVRAASVLGVSAYADRSPPMLVMPLQISGGVSQMFEARTPWQQAWARFRTGNSTIDYIRPSGTGAEPLLMNAGQIGRRSRGWWRSILDQYGASDILIPVVHLYRQWPGGPVIGVFEARHGPDNRLLGTITLRVGNTDGLPQLLDTGVARLDALYQKALASGALHPDASLRPPPKPEAAIVDDTAPGEEPIAGLDAAITASGLGSPSRCNMMRRPPAPSPTPKVSFGAYPAWSAQARPAWRSAACRSWLSPMTAIPISFAARSSSAVFRCPDRAPPSHPARTASARAGASIG